MDMLNRALHRYHDRPNDWARWQGDSTHGEVFEVDFCTVARWDENGQIMEENLFYDLVGLMMQIGLK